MFDDYLGICSVCLRPIEKNQGIKLRENGRVFHKECVKKTANYYVALEIMAAKFENSPKDNTRLMSELVAQMEQIFKIPPLPNRPYEEENPEVMELYKKMTERK